MKKRRNDYVKNILFPCGVLSFITGVSTGIVIFIFKISSNAVINFSESIYAIVRNEPKLLPLLLLGSAVTGLCICLVLRLFPSALGGGIQTTITALRGYIPIKHIRTLPALFVSSMLTYLCGLPLGTEGPSIHMGTVIGMGTTKIFAKNHRAWDRYTMTGGACSGFAAATAAPLTGIFFAFEEAHRRFSPTIFMVASMSVVWSTATTKLLCEIFNVPFDMFDFSIDAVLPTEYCWIPIIIGIVCAISAIGFTKLYKSVYQTINIRAASLPIYIKLPAITTLLSLAGFFSSELLGSGHSLIDSIVAGKGVWYLLIVYFALRAVFMMSANSVGATGGLFVPSLAHGAILGALCAKGFHSIGVLPGKYYAVVVVVGMASFLAASSRTPITALTFAAEALCGFSNFLPVAIGVTFAFVCVELFAIPCFSDTVIEAKIDARNKGRSPITIDTYLTVKENAFIIGKEIRDILWPPSCVIISLTHTPSHTSYNTPTIEEGDILHVHYKTCYPDETAEELEALLGKQDTDSKSTSIYDKDHLVPEI